MSENIDKGTFIDHVKYVSLTDEELNTIKQVEDKINSNREHPLYLLAFENTPHAHREVNNANEYNVYSINADVEFGKELTSDSSMDIEKNVKKEREKAEDKGMIPWHMEDL